MQINYHNNYFIPISAQKVPFEGYKSVFSKQLDEVILNEGADGVEISKEKKESLISKMKAILAQKVNKRFELGTGCSASVFKIDDKYVLKFYGSTGKYVREVIDKLDKVSFPKSKFSNLKNYYGESVAVFGDDVEVIKNVSINGSHTPAGVPLQFTMVEDDVYHYYNSQYLPKLSQLPQRAFDNLAKDMALLNSMQDEDGSYYKFDYCNPNNFVLTGKSIRVVDEITKSKFKNQNTTLRLLDVLIGKPGLIWDYQEYKMYDSSAVPHRQEIFKKIIMAGEKYDLPLCKGPLADKDFGKILMYCEPNKFGAAVLDDISKLRDKHEDKSVYLSELAKYLDDLFLHKNIFLKSFMM